VSVPSGSASMQSGRTNWIAAELSLGFIPLAGTLWIAVGRNRKKYFCTVMALVALSTLIACGGSSKSSSSNPVTYNIQVQGTTPAQPTPVKLTVVQLTVQ
jgi:hypothetical protein